jgi:hypothetical protein
MTEAGVGQAGWQPGRRRVEKPSHIQEKNRE